MSDCEAEKVAGKLMEENQLFRKWVWLNHGHLEALYGDDGEMQCGKCLIDFRRDDAACILDRLRADRGVRSGNPVRDNQSE